MPTSNPLFRVAVALLIGAGLAQTAAAAQVCNPGLSPVRPDNQYRISGDGKEVTDLATGLIWRRCLAGMSWDADQNTCTGTASTMTYGGALAYAAAEGGGWRLPNIKELLTLVELACERPAINLTAFPGTPMYPTASYALSSSQHADSNGDAWRVDFNAGVDSGTTKTARNPVRLVRAPAP
ncbi:DUF1566 domain-containing protein [Solimonas variicoloris]|uniref:Lcl C-terminal domain-containing protein n=1 Tax=Solimonas variicoloris TaxID=254408 RepID=UPI00036BE0A5|nr:DUF1566 domain-containing protein [Solimonas variicoloris]